MTPDQRKSAALLLWPERQSSSGASEREEPGWPFPPPHLPPAPARFRQALAARRGRLGWESDVVEPLMRARQTTLGDAAAGDPKVLVRVDEYPHARSFDPSSRFGDDGFRRFHEVLAEAEIPYLLAISPRVSRDYLDPGVDEDRGLSAAEEAQLGELTGSRVTFALHGRNHRTRRSSPRRRSELCGLGVEAAAQRIDSARAVFDRLGIRTPVFVPPFNRFDSAQYPMLAERFEVVCGGPESVRLLGFHPTPVHWQGAVYLPSYPPLYGTALQARAGVERLIDMQAALWAPLTLHWGWELEDDFSSLRKLCQVLRGRTADWADFLAAVKATEG